MFSRLIPALVAAGLAVATAPCVGQSLSASAVIEVQNGRARSQTGEAYNRGYREGLRQGSLDTRGGLSSDYSRDPVYRDGTLGYQRRFGARDFYRDDFRRGYIDGYRQSYARSRVAPPPLRFDRNPSTQRRGDYGYQEPAYGRGYSDGLRRGRDAGRDRDTYDPIGDRDYRDGDQGYYGSYGPRDAYKTNYRAGYREGYEEGYRTGIGRR